MADLMSRNSLGDRSQRLSLSPQSDNRAKSRLLRLMRDQLAIFAASEPKGDFAA
jgi:hypothetical protein